MQTIGPSWLMFLLSGLFAPDPSHGYGLNIDPPELNWVAVSYFEMMREEVTVAAYSRCVAAAYCEPIGPRRAEEPLDRACQGGKAGRGGYPINCVTWRQADQFCSWVNGRLPNAQEWTEAAQFAGVADRATDCDAAVVARGSNSEGAGERLGCGRERPWPVCSRGPKGPGEGLCDMAGNVAEWTQERSDEGVDRTFRVIRGSGWADAPNDSGRATAERLRGGKAVGRFNLTRSANIGFRCAR